MLHLASHLAWQRTNYDEINPLNKCICARVQVLDRGEPTFEHNIIEKRAKKHERGRASRKRGSAKRSTTKKEPPQVIAVPHFAAKMRPLITGTLLWLSCMLRQGRCRRGMNITTLYMMGWTMTLNGLPYR